MQPEKGRAGGGAKGRSDTAWHCWKTLVVTAFLVGAPVWLIGCKSDSEAVRAMAMLQQGNFRGKAAIGGSPKVAIEYGTTIKLGLDANFTADGEFDFSRPPGSGNAIDLALLGGGGPAKTEAPDQPAEPGGGG